VVRSNGYIGDTIQRIDWWIRSNGYIVGVDSGVERKGQAGRQRDRQKSVLTINMNYQDASTHMPLPVSVLVLALVRGLARLREWCDCVCGEGHAGMYVIVCM
jgi:hypothetical protein